MSNVKTKKKPTVRPTYKAGRRAHNRRSGSSTWIIAAVVLAIGVAAVAAVTSASKGGGADGPASAAVVGKVTSVPVAVVDQVGPGTAAPAPKPITAPALTADGKPRVLYVGAEYCPYCATERWPMVIALSRFGTFMGLRATHSSSTDVYPDTQTFSFHGARYTSKWISFRGYELETNQRQGDGYVPLDTLSPQDQQIFDTYDRAPYIGTGASSNGIPFIDFGGKFLIGGVTYDPSVLQGQSAAAIAGSLSDPTSAISQGAVGAANAFTAAICSMTGNQPGRVCADPAIQRIQRALK